MTSTKSQPQKHFVSGANSQKPINIQIFNGWSWGILLLAARILKVRVAEGAKIQVQQIQDLFVCPHFGQQSLQVIQSTVRNVENVLSLEMAMTRTSGRRDGYTISYHHYFT